MNERKKGWLALVIITLFLLLIGIIEALAQEKDEDFYQRLNPAVEQIRVYHDGIVIWSDRKTGQKRIFGNKKLSHKYFRPGSLMKLITAEAALGQGLWPNYNCDGQDDIGGKHRHCWTPKGHGPQELTQALAHSCNLYFSKLGNQLNQEGLLRVLKQYGFSQTKNISEEKNNPRLDWIDLAIGDSDFFKVTPLEMATFWDRYLEKLSQSSFQGIRQGLTRSADQGTASRLHTLDFPILSKTGTSDSQRKAYKTDAWFLGAFPAENPRYALLIFLKNAHGYKEPTELAEKIFLFVKEYYRTP